MSLKSELEHDEITSKVIAVLVDYGLQESKLEIDKNFYTHFVLDSLDKASINAEIEKTFGIYIDDSSIPSLVSIKALASYIKHSKQIDLENID